jgi:hypothetical protein
MLGIRGGRDAKLFEVIFCSEAEPVLEAQKGKDREGATEPAAAKGRGVK